MGRVEGKVALVTGAARGQGRCHAVRLAEEGADVVALDVCMPIGTVPYAMASADDLAETARLVAATGRRVIAVEADVRDGAALEETCARAVDELGRLDVVVANAGITSTSPALEITDEMWSTMIDVNLTGVWRTLRAAGPHMVRGGRGGSMIIVSSMATMHPNENIAHYTAAKTGLIGLMRVLAKELARHSVRVNTLHPGTVATPMVLNDAVYRLFRPDLENPTREDLEAVTRTTHALPVALIEPDAVADAVLYLASDESRYVTGSTMTVSAGNDL